jgi:hypothetical protein
MNGIQYLKEKKNSNNISVNTKKRTPLLAVFVLCLRFTCQICHLVGYVVTSWPSLAFPANILNAESEYGEGLLPHLQKEYGELGVNMAT